MKYTDIPKTIRYQMEIDNLIYGDGFCWKHEDGTFERIDPMKVILKKDGEYEIIE